MFNFLLGRLFEICLLKQEAAYSMTRGTFLVPKYELLTLCLCYFHSLLGCRTPLPILRMQLYSITENTGHIPIILKIDIKLY